MIFIECFRLYRILKVIFSYQLDELLPKMKFAASLRMSRFFFFWVKKKSVNEPIGVRLRLALQELGPIWVKFGQMLSTRRDLFPDEVADQLALLQDRVTPFEGKLARKIIEQSLNGHLEQWFDDFEEQALASASIAQVHAAKLKNGKNIVIKVIRPEIQHTMKADILLMYRLARWLVRLFPDSRRLRLQEVVKEYEKTIMDELNLLKETANTIQLRRNFLNSPLLYVPEVYPELCKENMLVMERIYGIPVSDIEALKKNNTNLKLLAERGVQVFFTQVFRDSFFHADMHPGNIFVNYEHPEEPQYIGIDCGIVGSLSQSDKRYLAENFIAFFNRDYRRVAQLHVDSGWVSPDTSIDEFESAIRMVCEPAFEKPLAEISFAHLLLNLFNIARKFNMEVQPQLVLLEKTLFYIEGLGRQLYPQLDLWSTAKPYLESWLKEQISVSTFLKTCGEKTPFLLEKLPELPVLLYDGLLQQKKLVNSVTQISIEMNNQYRRREQSRYIFGIGAILVLSGVLLSFNKSLLLFGSIIAIGIIILLIGWFRIKNSS